MIDIGPLRITAERTLPSMVRELARQHGFRYTALHINSARTRWGSCSSKGRINLSLYMVTLPEHLQRYVVLHELCHTREMNHGPRFWALLDSVTDNQARALAREMRQHHIPR